jgi:hypothetical protein
VPAPVQAGKRWVVERSHAWMNGFGKLRRWTERRRRVVDFYVYLSAAIVTLRILIRRATARSTAGTTAPPPRDSNDAYCRAFLLTNSLVGKTRKFSLLR